MAFERLTRRRRVNRHGGVDAEPNRGRRRFRAAVYRCRTPVLVQGVPVVNRVLLRVRVLLRDVRTGPQRYRSSHVARSRRQMVVEMRVRVELGESNISVCIRLKSKIRARVAGTPTESLETLMARGFLFRSSDKTKKRKKYQKKKLVRL